MKDYIFKLLSKLKWPVSSFVTPLIFSGAFLLLFGVFLYVINRNSEIEQSKDIQILAERIAKSIELRLKGNLDFIKLIAMERADGNISEQTFQSHVIHYLENHPEFINITWIDSSYVIKTVSPLKGNAHIIGLHIELPEPKRASRLATERKTSVYTKPFEAIQGHTSFEVWVPVYKNDTFLGLFAGVYSCEQLLRLAIPGDKQYASFISLTDGNDVPIAEYPGPHYNKKDILFHAPLTSLENGMLIEVEMARKSSLNWLLRMLTLLTVGLVIGFSYSLWKIKTEIHARTKIQEILKKNEIELKNQNTEYLALNEELRSSNNRIRIINQELLAAKEKAEESDRLKTAFLQNMSHEIRTPMNAIMGFSGLLKDHYSDKEKILQFGDIINQRSNDLLDIINDILDIAKIESGQLSISMEECNLHELFGELTSFFTGYQKKIGKQHIGFSLKAHCGLGDTVIITDKVKLKQIFINLISNAFKFTNEGRIEGGCLFDDKQNLLFYVADTGIGIPPDKQKAVFERFVQLKQGTRKNIGGTGLGLSIVKGLVNSLGGEIKLDSEPGKGSMFSFTVAYKTLQEVTPKDPEVQPQNPTGFSDKTILVVEDDFYNAEYLKEALSGIDVNILMAESGEEAVQISKDHPVDLVLMDIRLPGIDGCEAIKQIRCQKPDAKIIVQSAYASLDEKQKAMVAGCVDYISKPAKRSDLLSMVSKYLS